MRIAKTLTLIIICIAFVSCAMLGTKPWADRTPKEKALAILEAYNAQYQNTLSMALSPNLTEEQKQIVRTKKAIIKELHPLVSTYLAIVEIGGVPSAKDEQAILNLLDRLGGKI